MVRYEDWRNFKRYLCYDLTRLSDRLQSPTEPVSLTFIGVRKNILELSQNMQLFPRKRKKQSNNTSHPLFLFCCFPFQNRVDGLAPSLQLYFLVERLNQGQFYITFKYLNKPNTPTLSSTQPLHILDC